MLAPGGRLADEAEHVLDAFVTEADVHYSVMQAIAGGERSWSKITSRVGKPGGSLSRPLKWLEEMQLVARTLPITEDVCRAWVARSPRLPFRPAREADLRQQFDGARALPPSESPSPPVSDVRGAHHAPHSTLASAHPHP